VCEIKGDVTMTDHPLARIYHAYIECLNVRDWLKLDQFVHDDVHHNGRRLGVAGYRAMLERDVDQIPDLRFTIDLLVADSSAIASRLWFDCRPRGEFMGLHVDGKRVSFAENVFYEFRGGKIAAVWSVIDKAAIEAQLSDAHRGMGAS
jgi:predicted ester cyclase